MLFRSPDAVPVQAVGVPGIWVLAQVAEDGRSMLVSLNNLSGDVRSGVVFAFSDEWCGAGISRIAEDGSRIVLGRTSVRWEAPVSFAQMAPEFFLVEKVAE